MNTKTIIASCAILLSTALSSAAFAQSGTLSFSGSIVAPACTGSLQLNSINNLRNNPSLNAAINQCALSNATITRTHISTQTNPENTNPASAAIVTVSYE